MIIYIQTDPADQNRIIGRFGCPQPSLSNVHSIDDVILAGMFEPCYDPVAGALSEYKQSNAQIIASFETAIQSLLDATAQRKGYDSSLSCVSYAGGTGSFATEGAAMKTWRDSVWAYCYQQAALLHTATPPIPTADQFIAALLTSYPAPW